MRSLRPACCWVMHSAMPTIAYRLPIHGGWYKATLGHNTVLVDRKSQAPAAGQLECFAANDDYGAVVAQCTAAYPGIRHRRALCLTPTYLLVFDDLAGAGEHTFDWVYHNQGTAAECPAAQKAMDLGRAFAGAEYLDNVRTGVTADDIRVRFDGGQVATHLLLSGVAGTEILTATGPGGSVLDRTPLVMATRRGAAARFAAVLEPVGAKQSPAVTRVSCETARGNVRITVSRGASSDCFEIAPGGGVSLAVDNKTVLVGKPEQ